GLAPKAQWEYPLAFQEELLQYILERQERFVTAVSRINSDKPRIVLCDRGAFDAISYVGKDAFREILKKLGLSEIDLMDGYRSVIHMVTAADGAEAFYTLENSKSRSETPQEARELDRLTREAWIGCQHLVVIDNQTDFHGKIARLK